MLTSSFKELTKKPLSGLTTPKMQTVHWKSKPYRFSDLALFDLQNKISTLNPSYAPATANCHLKLTQKEIRGRFQVRKEMFHEINLTNCYFQDTCA